MPDQVVTPAGVGPAADGTQIELTIVRTISESTFLTAAAGLRRPPHPGQVLRCGPPGPADRYGTRYRVRYLDDEPLDGVGLIWARDPSFRPDASILRRFHRAWDAQAAAGPPGLTVAPLWHGTVRTSDGAEAAVVLSGGPATTDLIPLRHVLDTNLLGHLRHPLVDRLRLAGAVARSAAELAELPLVHGAIGAETVLVDPTEGKAAIAGSECGAVGRPGAEIPIQPARPDGYPAPELYDSWGVRPELATLESDRWSLAVVLHHVIFGTHPYIGAPDLSRARVGAALGGGRWPLPVHGVYGDWYARQVAALPPALLGLLRQTFVEGWDTPARRPTAHQWRDEIERWSAPPSIDLLQVDAEWVVLGGPLTVRWATSYTSQVEIIGPGTDAPMPVATAGSMTIHPPVSGPIRLRATGPLGVAESQTAKVLVLNLPRFSAADLPTPYVRGPTLGISLAPILSLPRPERSERGLERPGPVTPNFPRPTPRYAAPVRTPRVGRLLRPRSEEIR
jgi:hypothetical protein